MFQIKQKWLVGAIALFILSFSLTSVTFAGVNAAPYLRLGAGARSLGIGGAFTAVADDATSTVWNPAGLPSIWGPTVGRSTGDDWAFTFFGSKLALGTKHNFLAGVKKLSEEGSIGLSWINYGVDGLQEYKDAADTGGALFDYSSNAISLSYGHALENFNIGAGLGILTDSFSLDTVDGQTGFAGLSLGVLGYAHHHTTVSGDKIPTVSYGLALRNLGGSIADSNVPILLDLGVAFKRIRKNVVTFSLDLEQEFVNLGESTTSVRLGAEYLIASTFAIRGGARSTRDRQSFYGGFGVNVSAVQLDYAIKLGDSSVYDLGQGNTHFVSLSYSY
jgi:hypothetical protein